MVAILRCNAAHSVLAIVLSTLTVESADGQTIDFTWTSEGTFHGSPISGTVLTTFSSSASLDLTEFHATYTGQGGATRVSGPFEITAGNGDKLLGSFEIVGAGPIHLGMNLGSGPFTFMGGTGQFAGATGQGTLDVKTTLETFPTTTGTVEQEWRGTLTLVPHTLPGDYTQDGTVDAADYVVWRNTEGQTGAGLAADGNDNNQIDVGDYELWRGNFGRIAGNRSVSSSSVPEPSTALLLVSGLIALRVGASPKIRSLRRKRRHSTFRWR